METKNYLLEAKIALSNAKNNGTEHINLWDSDFATALFSLITCIKVKTVDTNFYEDTEGNIYEIYDNSQGTGARLIFVNAVESDI